MSRLLQHSSKISAKTRAVWIKRTTAKFAASILGVLCGVCTRSVERVTRLATSNRLLRESEARMRQVLENMPVMMNAFDADGLVVVWNRECERVTGDLLPRNVPVSRLVCFPQEETDDEAQSV